MASAPSPVRDAAGPRGAQSPSRRRLRPRLLIATAWSIPIAVFLTLRTGLIGQWVAVRYSDFPTALKKYGIRLNKTYSSGNDSVNSVLENADWGEKSIMETTYTSKESRRRVWPRTFYLSDRGDESRTQKSNFTSVMPSSKLPSLTEAYEENWATLSSYLDNGCQPLQDWQRVALSTCNNIHSLDWRSELQLKRLGDGTYREAWSFELPTFSSDHARSTTMKFVLKTLKPETMWSSKVYVAHQREAMALSHLTKSDAFAVIYGSCGFSSVVEFVAGPNLYSDISEQYRSKGQMPPRDLLQMASGLASAVADTHAPIEIRIHGTDEVQPIATMAHTDLKPEQFVRANDGNSAKLGYKVVDLNTCQFLAYKSVTKDTYTACPFRGMEPHRSRFRAPEELQETSSSSPGGASPDRADVYSLGNLLYFIATGLYPFEMKNDKSKEKVKAKSWKNRLMAGERPNFPEHLMSNYTNPMQQKAYQVLVAVIRHCWDHRPENRPSAQKISFMLRNAAEHTPR